jgi:hypothetical protein
MRHRALILCALALIVLPLVAGCDTAGLPQPAATATPQAQPTATDVAIVDPQPEPTATRAGRANTPTAEPKATETTEPKPTSIAGSDETPVASGTISPEKLAVLEQVEKDAAEFRGLEPKGRCA